jgi:hypothetical protein
VAADGAGRGARRIEEHGVEGLLVQIEHVGLPRLHGEPKASHVVGEPLEPARRAVDGEDLRAGERELGRLAAGRGAKVGDPLARSRSQKARGQRRRRILHPPDALGVAGQIADRRAVEKAHAAGRQERPLRRAAQALGLGLHGEIDGGGVPVRRRDAARGVLAVGRRPALGQPRGGIDA